MAEIGRPVLGVACGSLGALTSVKAPEIATALDRLEAGDFTEPRLPALEVMRDGASLGKAFNDLTVVRHGAGQVVIEIDAHRRPAPAWRHR